MGKLEQPKGENVARDLLRKLGPPPEIEQATKHEEERRDRPESSK